MIRGGDRVGKKEELEKQNFVAEMQKKRERPQRGLK